MSSELIEIVNGDVLFAGFNVSKVVGPELGVRQSLSAYSRLVNSKCREAAKLRKKIIEGAPDKYEVFSRYNPHTPFTDKADALAFGKLSCELFRHVNDILAVKYGNADTEMGFHIQRYLQNHRRVSVKLDRLLAQQRSVNN